MFENELQDLIRRRTSQRSYDGRPLGADDKKRLEAALLASTENPFGAQVRLPLIETATQPAGKLGTYGIIRGAGHFIAGVVKRGGRDLEGVGYAMEKAILHATDLGLGTCWLGGTFDHKGFAAAAVQPGEMLPTVSPVGYPAEKRRLLDSAMHAVTRAATRKPWNELFFDGGPATPLTPEAAGKWAEALEAVRLAPSASNGQPWRIVKQGDNLHFYNKSKGGAGFTRVDLGIAACHFKLTVNKRDLAGRWAFDGEPAGLATGWAYAFSWIAG